MHLRGEIRPVAENEACRSLQRGKEFGNISCRGTAARADADALAGHLGDRANPGILENEKVERRVVHREDRPHSACRLAADPCAGAVPGVERNAHRHESDLRLASFEQLDVLSGSFRGLHRHRKLEDAGQDLRQTLAIDVVGAAR
jgi:hypothetical protein